MEKFKAPFFRQPFNYDTKAASDEVGYVELFPSLTVQSMADDVDLNVIMKRYGITGKMPDNFVPTFYADFDEITDFRSANEAVVKARERFMELPAEVRSRFSNNPQLFLEFVENKDNVAEMLKMGLAISTKSDIIAPKVDSPPVESKDVKQD